MYVCIWSENAACLACQRSLRMPPNAKLKLNGRRTELKKADKSTQIPLYFTIPFAPEFFLYLFSLSVIEI